MLDNDLGKLRICVEKPLQSEENMLHNIRLQSKSEQHYKKLRAAFLTNKMWPVNSTISVGFYPTSPTQNIASFTSIYVMNARREPDGSSPVLDPIERKIRGMLPEDAIKTVVRERIQPICGLKFVFVSNVNQANVRIAFDANGGSWSLVGTDCLKTNKKTMNFAWLDAATIMHEFGHVLGMVHEHQNPRGNPIKWNIPLVDEWAKQTQGWSKKTTYRNIIQHYRVDQINGSKYDSKSIMLYFFPAKLTLNNISTNINERLSPMDIEYISKMYPGGITNSEKFYADIYGGSSNNNKFIKFPLILVWLVPLLIIVILTIIFFIYRSSRIRK